MKKEMKNMPVEELVKQMNEEREKVRTLYFSAGIAKSKNVKESRQSKKAIARIMTELAKRA